MEIFQRFVCFLSSVINIINKTKKQCKDFLSASFHTILKAKVRLGLTLALFFPRWRCSPQFTALGGHDSVQVNF